MPSPARLYGQVALFSGLTALGIGVPSFYFFGDVNKMLQSQVNIFQMQSYGLLLAFIILGLLFQYFLPVLGALAFFFGIPARKLWTAKIGMGAAACALFLLVSYHWNMYQSFR